MHRSKRLRTIVVDRIKHGFDFLGYHFGPAGLTVGKQTIARFIEKASRHYEQECREGSNAMTAFEVDPKR